jgi:hypothetical protein
MGPAVFVLLVLGGLAAGALVFVQWLARQLEEGWV